MKFKLLITAVIELFVTKIYIYFFISLGKEHRQSEVGRKVCYFVKY